MGKRRSRSCSGSRGSGSGSKKKQKCSSRDSNVPITISSPRPMQATKNFTPEQCDLIRRNGFGGLLSLKYWKNPPQLLYRCLLKHFSCATSELILSNGTIIPVTAKSVQRILGIPHGSKKVKHSIDDDSVAFMKHEYCYDGLPPRISNIAKELSEMKKADDRFLRTFLLLAVSCFLCTTTCHRVSPHYFPSLVDISCVAQLDWCGFVLERLIYSIKRYKHKQYIGGCLIFLAVHYLDHPDTGSYHVPDSIPRIGAWTNKVIEDVVNMDTVSEADGICGQRPAKDGLCRMVNNFCTNATSHLSMFIGSFLRDVCGLISSPSNTSLRVCQKLSLASSRGTSRVSEDEGADEYNTEDETSEADVFVSDDASEDEPDDEMASSESFCDDVSNHDDASEESCDGNASLDASGNELVHEKDSNTGCKEEVSEELFPESPVPPGFSDIPRFKQEPVSPTSDRNLHQYTESNKFMAVPSGSVQKGQQE